MISKQGINNALNTATTQLIAVIKNFTDAAFNTKPANGGWSPAEVAEHILLLESAVALQLGNDPQPMGRKGDEKIEQFKSVLQSDFKVNAPEAFHPKGGHTKDYLINALQENRNRLTELIDTIALDKYPANFRHPMLGGLSNYEWLYLVVYHAERHIKQMQA